MRCEWVVAKGGAAIAVAALLAGCAGPSYVDSPGYRPGFQAGCETAAADARGETDALVYDRERFAADPAYHAGWSEGYATCLARERRPQGSDFFFQPLGMHPCD